MKLSDYLTLRLSGLFIFILLIWSVVYFFIQMEEVYDGIDEGLNNLKQELILEANAKPGFMSNMEKYDPLNLIIEKISYDEAIKIKETYSTDEIYFKSEEEFEEVRLLTTAFFCEQDNQYYKVRFFTSTVESDDMIKNMLYLLIALWVMISLVLIIATKSIINKSNKPFYILLNNLKRFHLNDEQMIEFEDTKITEYSDLNYSVKELLEKNINIFSEQKNFIENASHELQTPIAVASNKLELMMNGENLTRSQLEDINTVLSSLGRAKRLNSSLLLLSKIKNRQFTDSVSVNLAQIVEEVLENFEALIHHKEITLSVERQGDPVIAMNQDLAYIMVNNLVKNAIAHNVKNGTIRIIFTNDSVCIENNGADIPGDVDIFERYTSHTENSHSAGLGLSIVKSIVGQYKMTISHTYYDGIHKITLKLKKQ